MKSPLPTLLALACSLALAGAAAAAEPDDPQADPAESHHGGGDPGQHSRTVHPVEGVDRHDHDEPGSHSHMDGAHCAMPSTGDADQDFALRMRHHHLMGIEMAKKEIAGGDDAEMKAMAQAIVDAQTAEVAELDAWLMSKSVHPDKYLMQCGMHGGMHGPMDPAERFEALDEDGDGYLEHAELTDTHPMHRHFEMADTDRDGKLSRAEVEAHHAAMKAGDAAPRLTSAPHPSAADQFAALDDNGDGYLTLAELSADEMLHQHFSVADTDADGKLTAAEVDAHHAQMHSSHAH